MKNTHTTNSRFVNNKLSINNLQIQSQINSSLSTNNLYETIINSKSTVSNIGTDSNSLNTVFSKSFSSQNSNINLFDLLSQINKFDRKLALNKYIVSPFNKSFPFEGLKTKMRGTVESLPFAIASKIIKYTFLSIGVFISVPVFNITHTSNKFDNEYTEKPNRKVHIQLFYYVKTPQYRLYNNYSQYNHDIIKDLDLIHSSDSKENFIRNNILVTFNNRMEYLVQFLGNIFKSDIELECIRLNKSYFESNILVQDLAMKSYRDRFVKLTRKLFRKAYTFDPSKIYKLDPYIAYPSLLSGIHIKLAGRAFKQKIIPRMTVKSTQKGTLTHLNVKLLDKGRFTGKTRRGSYTFTVTLAHLIK